MIPKTKKSLDDFSSKTSVKKNYSKGGAIWDVSTNNYSQRKINSQESNSSINSADGIDSIRGTFGN
jgi:hypothetical protein